MFKVFLLFLTFFFNVSTVFAQTRFKDSEGAQERHLSRYINASAVCSKMTNSEELFDRGMLLLSDKNEEAYLAAVDCFTSAAMRNHTPSQIELGKLYEKGNGISKSNIFAYKWYQTAVLLGDKNAIDPRDKLELVMSLDDISTALPMVQSTLDLLTLFEEKRQQALMKYEAGVNQKYEKFGVDISDYEEKHQVSSYSNPLIEVLIRDQEKKEKDAERISAQQSAQKNTSEANAEELNARERFLMQMQQQQ